MACMKMKKKRMELVKDERGQWIISAGFLVSVSIIILALLLNQAMMGGYQSSGAILEFPKHEIRELVQETHREVIIAADRAWEITPYNDTPANITKDQDAVRANFTIANFTEQMLPIYATHGQFVNISLNKMADISFDENGTIERVNVTILFSDGVTTCTFEPELIEIPVVPEPSPTPSPSFIETLYAVDLTCDCTITNESNAYDASDNVSATVSDVYIGDTVNATINDTSVGSGNISSVKFEIRLRKTGAWNSDEIVISYSPDNGSTWLDPPAPPVNTFKPSDSLNWYGNYTATNVTTWGEVNNMTIRITGISHPPHKPVDGDLEIDAYHVYVVYEVP